MQLASTPANERPTLALAALASPGDETERPLVLAALALVALVVASGNLLYLLTRTDVRWRKA